MTLHTLNRACTACPLHEKCLGPVPGMGDLSSLIAFIGEAPGRDEDKKAKPWQGRAGRYLCALLLSIGLRFEDVFLSNVVKCRPEGNATPTVDQARFCGSRWLDMELSMMRPKILVTLGAASTRYVLKDDTLTMDHWHGVPIKREMLGFETIVLPCYHPAAGLHRTELNGQIQDDFRVLGELIKHGPERFERVDQYPEPVYRQEYGAVRLDGPVTALDTETVEGKLWSIQVSDKPGTGYFFQQEGAFEPGGSTMVVHNYLYDAQFVDLPAPPRTRDTMVMAYLLGQPQSLKTLAWRLCGMEMKEYDEYVRPFRHEKMMAYLEEAKKGLTLNIHDPEYGEWPPPPTIYDEKWDKKTQTLKVKELHPKHISKKIASILKDVEKGKVTKDGPTDPWKRWHDIRSEERAVVEEVLGTPVDASLADISIEEAVTYSTRDADATLRVDDVLWPQILEQNLLHVFNVDMQTQPIAMEMMKQGIKLDMEVLKKLSGEFFGSLEEKAEEIFLKSEVEERYLDGYIPGQSAYRPKRFNPNSDAQVRTLLFTDLKFTPTKYTETGLPSVAKDEISKIDHPVIAPLKEYKHIAHLKDSFCDTLPGHVDQDGRIHTTIRTTRTATGRWSMADPNPMQIPIRTALGRRIREAFVSEESWDLLEIDYSQIEMRVLAHVARCGSMIGLFQAGRDIHTETAAEMWGTTLDAVRADQRYAAKATGFGVAYGLTAHGLYNQFQEEGIEGWTLDDCEEFIKDYFKLRPEVWTYQEETKGWAIRNGYVVDMFGRRRWVPEILTPDRQVKGAGERMAINMPIQGGAQGIIKMAMIKLWNLLPDSRTRWLLQIHDSLLWEVKEDMTYYWAKMAMPPMESIVKLSVPVIVEAKVGKNWSEMTKW